MRRAAHRNPESGYALLFVYAMAATVAIMLFMELPRVAFEAQRDKEQLLIDRGEQYSRAINLYVRKFNRYPADFDALNNTQNQRFLRHKYIDPMTGKDDWRIIHVGPGGVFTDSLIYNKKKTDDKDKPEQQNFITELQQTGGNQPDPNQQAVNLATRQRPSDQAGAPGDPNNPNPAPQFDANGQPIPNNPAPVQVLPNGTIVPVQTGSQQPPVAGQFPPGMNGIPNPAAGATFPPVPAPQQAGTTPTQSGFPFQQQPFGQQPFGQQAGQQTPQTPNVPQTAAANLIGQLLTTPRPGGLNGLGAVQPATVDQNGNPIQGAAGGAATTTTGTAATTAAPAAAQTIGGGIAGVASKVEQKGIKIYKDEKSYNKWEFVYDITKDPMRGGGAAVPQPAGAQNGAGQNGIGQNAATQNGATQAGAQNGLQSGTSPTTGAASPAPITSPPTTPPTQ